MTPKTIQPIKSDAIEKLSAKMKAAQSVVFVDYTGMGVKTQQELKNRLKSIGGNMIVAKNTLLQIAGSEANIPAESLTDDILSGQTALVIGNDDAVAPIQIVGKFASEFELPKFKAGSIDGTYYNSDNLIKVSKLPSKEVLVGQALGAIAAPMYAMVGTLQGNLQKLLYILTAKQAQN